MAPTDPETRRAERLAAIRAQRGTQDREREIAELASRRRIDPPPPSGAVRTRRTTSAPRPRRTAGQTAATGFFGHPWPEWHAMVDTARDLLIEHAEAGATLTEGELWRHVGDTLDLRLEDPTLPMPFLLRDVTNRDVELSGVLLSALAVTDEGVPAPAFFRLAAQHGKLPTAQAPRESADPGWSISERQEEFWRRHLAAVFAWYQED